MQPMNAGQVRHNVGVLFSESSHRAHAEAAMAAGEVYVCRDGSGRMLRWLRGARAYLGPGGALALLRRLGIGAELVRESSLEARRESLEPYDWLIVTDAIRLESSTIAAIAGWLDPSKRLVVCGATNLPSELLGVADRRPRLTPGYVGLVGADTPFDGTAFPWALPGYPMEQVCAASGSEVWAEAVEWRLTGDEAKRPRSNGIPGIVATSRVFWLIPPLFACAGALLQGQEDLGDGVREQLGASSDWYLDGMAAALGGLLRQWGGAALWACRPQPWGEGDHALVLRHDTDGAPNGAYLEYERAEGIAATYPLLDQEGSRDVWLKRLADDPLREVALHYRTNEEPTNRLQRLWRRADRIDPEAVCAEGLSRQLREAERRFGQPIATLHRHYQFLLYPELWLGLEHALALMPSLVGSSSMSRYALFPYQGTHARRSAPTAVVPYPRAAVSLWALFHPVTASVERWSMSPLWESGSLIEPNPEQVDACLAHAERVPGGCYTMIYHPTHARRGPYRREGHEPWFRHAVWQARRRGWLIATYETACRTARAWEAARWRVERVERVGGEQQLIVANPTTAPIGPLTFRLREGLTAAETAGAGDERLVVPSLAPGEMRRVRLQRIGVPDVAGVV